MGDLVAVGVIGLGYVGLPLAVAFAEAGDDVVGVDLDARRVSALQAGESYIEDIGSERLRAIGGKLRATTRTAHLAPCESIVICVPTPLTPNREPDLTALNSAVAGVAQILQSGQLIVLESTTYPGTTRDRVVPVLEESGMTAGQDFHVAYSPERIDPGRIDYTLRTTPKIVGGLTPYCGARAAGLYGRVCDRILQVDGPEPAEMAKLLENTFRSVNIALANEMSILADRMGVDIWEVIDAASSKPFGFMRFEPGPGMGGHCLPVDPFYLAWKAREYDFCTEFIELAGKVNQQMPYFSVERVERALSEARLPVRDARVLLLGVSYKAGVGDVRESPALKMIKQLRAHGVVVSYHDPYVAELPAFDLRSVELDKAIAAADIAVIVTAHAGIDYVELSEQLPLVDLRGVLRRRPATVTGGFARKAKPCAPQDPARNGTRSRNGAAAAARNGATPRAVSRNGKAAATNGNGSSAATDEAA